MVYKVGELATLLPVYVTYPSNECRVTKQNLSLRLHMHLLCSGTPSCGIHGFKSFFVLLLSVLYLP